MTLPNHVRALCLVLVAAAWIGLPTSAAAQGVGGQQPITIDGKALLEVEDPKLGPGNPIRIRIELHVVISGNKVSGSISRNVTSKDSAAREIQGDTVQFSGWLGRPREVRSEPGYAVAILSGNTLTLLQTLKTGAIKATIRIGSGCGMRIDHAREVGKGHTQRKGIHGQDIEIAGWRQVSSSCRITRG